MKNNQEIKRPPVNWRRYHQHLIAAAERNVTRWERAPLLFAKELAEARRELELYRDTLPAE